jgi:hypothetical protein
LPEATLAPLRRSARAGPSLLVALALLAACGDTTLPAFANPPPVDAGAGHDATAEDDDAGR